MQAGRLRRPGRGHFVRVRLPAPGVAAWTARPYLSVMFANHRKSLVISGLVAAAVALFAAWVWHGNPSDRPIEDTMGKQPVLGESENERIPSISLAEPVGWAAAEAPKAAAGLVVGRFAEGLNHPRTILSLPNGDVLVAETNAPHRGGSGLTGFVARQFMNRVGAGGKSPNRIVLLRDSDGDGAAEQRFTFREKDMDSPSGMALGGGKLYIANHDAVLAFDFAPGATALVGPGKKLMDLPPGGNHWMRSLIISPDGKFLYVAVGSGSNIGEDGMQAEQGRAAIWEINLASGSRRQFAGGMRNPNGMDWNPSTGELWAVVQERDMLGPDLVPDYLTNVPVGAQYGWPWVYWKEIMDWRVKEPVPDFLTEYTRKPEFALGAHAGALGLVFSRGGNRLGDGFANGAFIARHGSWNRKPFSGYDVIFVPFDASGNPGERAQTVLSGFLTGKGSAHGRPVWLAWDKAGALLLSDDTGGVIWRVLRPGAASSAVPKPVVTQRMPPQRELKGDPAARFEEPTRP